MIKLVPSDEFRLGFISVPFQKQYIQNMFPIRPEAHVDSHLNSRIYIRFELGGVL